MRAQTLCIGMLCGLAGWAGEASAARPGPRAKAAEKVAQRSDVGVLTFDWLDARRQRPVPVKIYYPEATPGPLPVIVFSHGLGMTRDDYAYLGQHWAGQGFVSVHVQHHGSDKAEIAKLRPKESAKHAFADPANTFNRGRDISFAIDQLEEMNRTDKRLAGRLDLAHLGVAGHAFGSLTALTVAGQVLWDAQGQQVSLADPRVKAVLAMSSPVPSQRETHATIYKPIHVPCLHMTGTKDDSPIGSTRAGDRRVPYDQIDAADEYLIVFQDADHMTFLGHRLPRIEARAKDPVFHDLIIRASTAFWNAYLKDDAGSKAWLSEGGFRSVLGGHGTLETKLKAQ